MNVRLNFAQNVPKIGIQIWIVMKFSTKLSTHQGFTKQSNLVPIVTGQLRKATDAKKLAVWFANAHFAGIALKLS